jgi:acyl-CoA thioester hydrolase
MSLPKEYIFKDIVRIYDTDAQGIVHYAGYYRFFTDATESFARERLGISYPMLNDEVWFVVVESNAKYRRPAKLGEVLSVHLAPEVLSEKAIKFNFRIFGDSQDSILCEGYITQVAINRKIWKAIPIPSQVLDKIKEFMSI